MNRHELNVASALVAGTTVDLDPEAVVAPALASWLRGARELTRAGRPLALSTLSEYGEIPGVHSPPHPDVLDDSISKIVESHTERRVRAAARESVTGYCLVDRVLAAASNSGRGKGRQFGDIIADERKLIQEGKTRARYLATGIPKLDEAIGGGLPRGVVTVVGARPGVGKSSLVLAISDGISEAGGGVRVVSLEDPAWRYAYRLISRRTGVPVSLVGHTSMAKFDLPKSWVVDDNPGQGARSICRSARAEGARNGTQLVVVDYAQLLRGSDYREPEHLKLGDALSEFVLLARQMDAAVVVVSLLNRNAARAEKASMADLKASGSFEEVAKLVLLLDRAGEEDDATLEVNVAKNNFGRAGQTLSLNWDGATCRVW